MIGVNLLGESPKAMVSSMASVHAEREVIADDLRQVFDTVVQAPERSVGGSRSNDYLEHASSSHFMVVLLGQSSRPAVKSEIEYARKRGCEIAAFTLQYPPFLERGQAWTRTAEEDSIREMGIFVKPVLSITELRKAVKDSLALFVANSVNRFRMTDFRQNYATAIDWMGFGEIKRVALVQQTSILALGPRIGKSDEREAHTLLCEIAKAAKRAQGPEFVHIFNKRATLIEAQGNGQSYDLEGASALCKGLLSSRANRIHFGAIENVDMTSILLVNDRVGISVPVGTGGTRVILLDDRGAADNVMADVLRNKKGQVDAHYFDTIEQEISRHHL